MPAPFPLADVAGGRDGPTVDADIWRLVSRPTPAETGKQVAAPRQTLGQRVAERPQLAEGVEITSFTTRWGESYTMIKTPRGPTYFRLSAEDGRVAALMDGSRTISHLAAAELETTGAVDVEHVTGLVEVLARNGFLRRPFVDTYRVIRSRTTERETRVGRVVRRLFRTQTIHFPFADAATDLAYRFGGRLLFTRPAQVLMISLIALGPIAFVLDMSRHAFRFEGYGLAGGVLVLFALDMVATIAHEAGHALAIRHAGRRVNGAGFQLYLGHPAFFIDSADILMAPKRERIRNGWYGPYMSLVVAGLASLVVFLWPSTGFSGLLFQLAALTYLTALLNLIPFLELDGYWILTDAFDMPDLRPRSLALLRELPGRIRRRTRLSGDEWGLVAFGIVGIAFTALSLWTSWLILRPVFARFVETMWSGGVARRALLLALGALVFGPLVRGAWSALRALARPLRFAARRLRFASQRSWRVDAGELIDALPLFAGRIPIDDLNRVAGAARLRRYPEGSFIVRQGASAEAFFVVRRGRVVVTQASPAGGEHTIAVLRRGQAFGELGLLHGAPRLASVRAVEESECFAVPKSAFERYLAPHMSSPEISSVVEAWWLPPFRRLRQDAAMTLATSGTWLNVTSDVDLIEQGAAGDAFFVLASGQAEVVVSGRRVGTLQAGDPFGERALLDDAPRAATIRTLTPARVFRLDRDGFDRLVAASFKRRWPARDDRPQTTRD